MLNFTNFSFAAKRAATSSGHRGGVSASNIRGNSDLEDHSNNVILPNSPVSSTATLLISH